MSDRNGPAHRRRRPGAVRVADVLAAHGRAAPSRRGLRMALLAGGGAAAAVVVTVVAVAVSGPSPATAPVTGDPGSTEAETAGSGPVTLSDVSRPAILPSPPDAAPVPAAPVAPAAEATNPGTTARQGPTATRSRSTSRPAPRPAPSPAPDPEPAPEPAPQKPAGVLDGLRGLFP